MSDTKAVIRLQQRRPATESERRTFKQALWNKRNGASPCNFVTYLSAKFST